MKGLFWISLSLGFLLIAQGVPVEDPDPEYQEDQDGDSEDEEPEGPPPVLHSRNKTIAIETGGNVVLPCVVENSESAVILWWMGSNVLYTGRVGTNQAKDRPYIELLKDNSLSIKQIPVDDLGSYTCEVITTGNKEESQKVYYFVGTAAKPLITQITPSHGKNVIAKGSSLTLTCTATGSPPPRISFTKKTKHGSHEDHFEGASITFEQVTRKHSGIYECKAKNDAGVDTKSVEVHVQYKPEIEVVKEFVNTVEGSETELTCIVHSEPKAEVDWFKENKPIGNDQSAHTQNDNKRRHSLKLQNTKTEDFGVYKCMATNSLGSSEKTITVSGKPTKPIFHTASASSDGKSPELSWKVESLSPISEYELLYKMQDAGDWKTAYPIVESSHLDKGVFIVKHVLVGLHSQSYQAQLRAKNNYGWSPLSEPHTFSGNIEAPQEEPSAQEPLGAEQADQNRPSAACQLRISFAFIVSILIARFYC